MFFIGVATILYLLGGMFVGFLTILGELPWYRALPTALFWPLVVPVLRLSTRFR